MNAFAHLLWALGNAVWQSAVVACLAWVALRSIRRTSAALRYSVWGAVLLAAAVLPVINAIEPARVTYAVAPDEHSQIASSALPASHALSSSHPLSSSHASYAAPIRLATSDAKLPVATPSLQSRLADWSRAAAPAAALWIADRAAIAVWVWAAVALVMLARLGLGLRRLRYIKGRLVSLSSDAVLSACTSSSRRVTVGVSNDVDCPCVIGYARPAVALPATLVENLDGRDLTRILAHEIGHVRRFDDWANLAEQLVRAVWFFNPVVHVACRNLDINREIACDDLVAAGRDARLEYAKCLTEIARRTTFAEHLMPAAGFFPDRSQIVVRIERLLDRNHDGSPRLGIAPAISAVALVVVVLMLGKYQVPALALGPASPPRHVYLALAEHSRAHAVSHVHVVAQIAKTPVIPPAKGNAEPAVSAPVAAATATVESLVSQLKIDRREAMVVKTNIAATAPAPAPAPAQGQSRTDEFLDALAAAGYTHLSVDDLIALRNAGITAAYLHALRDAGLTPMPVPKLIALANAGVTPDYIASMRDSGYGSMSADDLISMANAGVTPRLAQAMTHLLHQRPSPTALRSLANAGVSPSYITALASSGYANLSADSLIQLANAGVSARYVTEMAKQGYAQLSISTLTALANAGVSPAYVRSLADAGYSGMSADTLIRMANAGVTANLIKTLRSHGIGDHGNLSVDELIRLANQGFQ